MYALAFWKNWPLKDRWYLGVLAAAGCLAISLFWLHYSQNPAPAIEWEHYQQLQTNEVTTRSFSVGLLEVPVKADNLFVFETQAGSSLTVAPLPAYGSLILFLFSVSILLALVTTLSRLWFLAGMLAFSLLIVSLGLEATEILEQTNKYPSWVLLFVLICVCYYFHAFAAHVSFYVRWVAIIIVFAIAGLCISWLATVQVPFLHLAAHSYTASVAITIIFILLVGHEIPATFITLLTQGTRQTKSLQHFLLLSAFYLLNLLLAYAREIGYLTWNIWTVNAYFLLVLSTVVGLWGFLQRQRQGDTLFADETLATWFYLALAIIAFATLSTLLASDNENATDVLHDIIMYSHLGYGIIFIFYVIANFGPMLMQNLQVHKVLYKPNIMHFVTFRIMGFITCIAFMFFDTSYGTLVNQLYASYYNAQGDVYYYLGADKTAEAYYNKSVFYRNQNHHAHYALASIQESRLEPTQQKNELASICVSSPSEYAYVNLSTLLREGNEPYQALFLLNKAHKKFPQSGAVQNALGITYAQLNVSDSALLSFQAARQDAIFKTEAETNLLAASAKFKIKFPADSLLQLLGANQEGALANAMALANLQQIPINKEYVPSADTLWTPKRVTYLCNYLINRAPHVDTTLLSTLVEIARKPVNEFYTEAIIVAAAHAYYAQGSVKKAMDLTREMAFASGRGRYYSLLATWLLEQGNASVAARYFEIAKEKKVAHSLLYEALAYTEADSLNLAKPLWDSLLVSGDKTDSTFARTLLPALTTKTPATLTDTEKYWYCRYRVPLSDSARFFSIVRSFSNPDLRTRALLEASKKWYRQDEPEIAAMYLNRIEAPPATSALGADLLLTRLFLLAKLNPEAFRKQNLASVSELIQTYPNEITLLTGWQTPGNHGEQAARYEHLAYANIYFEDGLIAAADYFANTGTDRLKPYTILMSGLIAIPNSIKLLKAHIRYAAQIGFNEQAQQSLDKLKSLIAPRTFNRFIQANPDIFSIED
ncbi:MAG: hypothetical protein KF775_12890 [Cyclobacteriaceae bacterium]|nr:hypothetical protein [Cyclobacteriaceae bacterium]